MSPEVTERSTAPATLIALMSPDVDLTLTEFLASSTWMSPEVACNCTGPVALRTNRSPEVTVRSVVPVPSSATSPERNSPRTATPAGAWISYVTEQLSPHEVSMVSDVPVTRYDSPGFELLRTIRLIVVSFTAAVLILTSPL